MVNAPSSTFRLILIVAFYFQANIAGMMGIPRNLILYVLLGLCVMFGVKTKIRRNAPEISILFGIIILLFYRLYMSIFSGAFISAVLIALPALILSITPRQGRAVDYLFKFIFTFYIIECVVAIIELVTHHYMFGYSESTYGDGKWHFTSTATDFRAVSMCGSPLNNALIVTIINAFILFSHLSNRKKLLCFGMGLLAVFAFNARASAFLFLLEGVLYGLREFSKRGMTNKIRLLSLGLIIGGIIIFCLSMGMGSRLLRTAENDGGSIEVRLKLFEYFETASLKDYLWGTSFVGFEDEKDYIDVPIIENFWIEYMILLGLIPLMYFTFCYFRLSKKLFEGYDTYTKWVISFIFLANISINNSMTASYSPLSTFLLCIIAFKQHRKEGIGIEG